MMGMVVGGAGCGWAGQYGEGDYSVPGARKHQLPLINAGWPTAGALCAIIGLGGGALKL